MSVEADNEGMFTCHTRYAASGWRCTRDYNHSGTCAAVRYRRGFFSKLFFYVFGIR